MDHSDVFDVVIWM